MVGVQWKRLHIELQAVEFCMGLTGGVGANIDDLALGSVDLVLIRG